MRPCLHIARRDLRSAIAAPMLWLVLATWLFIVHGFFVRDLWQLHGQPVISYTPLYANALWIGGLVLMLFAPALTMNAWAAERAQGTWQLLMTVAVRERDLVLGKFLAAWALLLLLLAATVAMPATLAVVSDVALPHALACYLGLALLAAFLAALGTWIGLLVDGPVAAYILTFGVIAALWLAGIGQDDGLGILRETFGLGRRINPFIAGRLDLAGAVWLLAGAALCLLLAHGAVRTLRLGGGQPWWRRAGMLGAPVAATGIVLVLLVAAAHRADLAVDLSADRRYSLSPALVRQLAATPGRIELYGVWPEEHAGALAPVADAAERMAAAARDGTWRRLDPVRHRPALDDLAARFGDPAPPALWVVRGTRAVRLPLSSLSRRTVQRDVAGALLTLDDPAPPTVRLLQGHGELRPDGAGEDGCRQLVAGLHAAGLRTATVDDAAPPPPASDVLAVLGPTTALGEAALARLDTHLRDGGGVLVLADDRAPRDLGVWLRRRGVVVAGALPRALIEQRDTASLLDPAATCLPATHLVSLERHFAGGGGDLPHHRLLLRGATQLNEHHPLTAPLVAAGVQLLSPFTGPCEAVPSAAVAGAGTPAYEAQPLLRTMAGDAWERRRGEALAVPEGLAQAEARTIAWALAYQPAADAAVSARGPRLMVWGSRQAAADPAIGQAAFANGQFLATACRWLAHREAPPDVPEAEVRAFQVIASDGLMNALAILLVAILPVLGIGVALLTWFDRRR